MATPTNVGLDFQYTIEKETTFGTAVDSAPSLIPTENMDINHDPQSHVLSRARGLRGDSEQDAWQDQVNSIPTTTVSFYVSMSNSVWFPSVLQKSTAYSAAANVFSYLTYNYSDLPDFAANEGFFYTLTSVSPEVGRDEYIASAIGNSLRLSIAPDANEGALMAEIDFMGKTSTRGATVSGTIGNEPLTNLFKWDAISSVTCMGVDVSALFYSADVSVSNGAKFVPAGGSSNIALPKWEVTGSLTLLGDAGSDSTGGTETLMGKVLSKLAGTSETALEIEFGSGSMNAQGDAKITVFGNLTGWSQDKAEEHTMTFDFVGLFGGAAEYPFTFAVFDDS